MFLALGKLGYGEVFSSLMYGDRLCFSSHLKCHQEATHNELLAVTSLTVGTEMFAIVFDN